MVMDIIGVRVREPIRNGMCIAIHTSGRIRVRVRDGDGVMGRVRVLGRVRVRVSYRVRVMERLAGVRVGRPIGKGIRIAIQASSSLLLPDPRMLAAKAALVRRGVGVSMSCCCWAAAATAKKILNPRRMATTGVRGVRVRVRVRVRVGVQVQVLVGAKVSVMVVEID